MREWIPTVVGPALFVGLVLAIFCVWILWVYGDLYRGWQRFNGIQLCAGDSVLDLGEIPAGQTKSGNFRLRNLGGKSVVVLGTEVGCACVTANELPMTVPPYAAVHFEIVLQTDEQEIGPVQQEVLLNVSVKQPTVILTVNANVVDGRKVNTNNQWKGTLLCLKTFSPIFSVSSPSLSPCGGRLR